MNDRPQLPAFIVKVCGVTTRDDLNAALDAGANAIGLNFYQPSVRYVDIELAAKLAKAIPAGVLRVGVFVNAMLDELIKTTSAVPLDILQLHGQMPEQTPDGMRTWQALPADQRLLNFADTARREAYLLDTPSSSHGGSGVLFDWTLAAQFNRRKIVAGGLDDANVQAAIRATDPWGVDACSKLESAPGIKDEAKIRSFVKAALTAFAHRPALEAQAERVF